MNIFNIYDIVDKNYIFLDNTSITDALETLDNIELDSDFNKLLPSKLSNLEKHQKSHQTNLWNYACI